MSHQRGGGTERHIQEEVQRFLADSYGVFFFRPIGKQATYATLSVAEALSFVNLAPLAIAQLDDLITTLKNLHITAIYLHSLVDFSADTAEQLTRLVGELGIPLDIKLHDYEVICPRIHLADEQGYYCGEPNVENCNQCLLKRGSDFAVTDISRWRTNYGQLLAAANKIVVPDSDVAQRLIGYFPERQFIVTPHELLENPPTRLPVLDANEKLRIVIIGMLSPLKGFHVLHACADYAKKNQLPLEFILMGYSKYDKRLEQVNVQVTGKYQEQDALQQLNELKPHIVWLPSIWPETYSYTLSLALIAAYPVFAFSIGAIANRLRALNRVDGLMPLEIAYLPSEITEQFINYRHAVLVKDNTNYE
jgi:glycosyltransferase involved in cell wall biosynthesis